MTPRYSSKRNVSLLAQLQPNLNGYNNNSKTNWFYEFVSLLTNWRKITVGGPKNAGLQLLMDILST